MKLKIILIGLYLPRGLELVLSWDQLLYTQGCYYTDDGYVTKPAWVFPAV